MAELDLAQEIVNALRDYTDEVEKDLQDEKKKIAQEAALKLKSASRNFSRTGKYAEGWTVKKDGDNYTVWNAKRWFTTHLIENSHALRNGGRSKAKPHITPVDNWVAQELVERVERRLS